MSGTAITLEGSECVQAEGWWPVREKGEEVTAGCPRSWKA